MTARLIASIALVALTAFAPPLAQAAEKALCIVCNVKSGETHLETVAAERTYENVRYTFCADACAEEFDADPLAYTPPKFPREAPAIEVTDLAGQSLTNASYAGQVVLLDFWATWCKPCTKTLPELQAIHDKYKARGFTVLGVSIDEDGPAKVNKFVTAKKIRYPIALDAEKSPAWERYRVKAVPAAFLIDRDGNIVAQWTGRPVDVKELETKLAGLLASAQETR